MNNYPIIRGYEDDVPTGLLNETSTCVEREGIAGGVFAAEDVGAAVEPGYHWKFEGWVFDGGGRDVDV